MVPSPMDGDLRPLPSSHPGPTSMTNPGLVPIRNNPGGQTVTNIVVQSQLAGPNQPMRSPNQKSQPLNLNMIPPTRRSGTFGMAATPMVNGNMVHSATTMSPMVRASPKPPSPPPHLNRRPWTQDFVPLAQQVPTMPRRLVSTQHLQPKVRPNDMASIVVAPPAGLNSIPVNAGFQVTIHTPNVWIIKNKCILYKGATQSRFVSIVPHDVLGPSRGTPDAVLVSL